MIDLLVVQNRSNYGISAGDVTVPVIGHALSVPRRPPNPKRLKPSTSILSGSARYTNNSREITRRPVTEGRGWAPPSPVLPATAAATCVASGKQLPIEGHGNLVADFQSGQDFVRIELFSVAYVPSLGYHLLSIPSCIGDGYTFVSILRALQCILSLVRSC